MLFDSVLTLTTPASLRTRHQLRDKGIIKHVFPDLQRLIVDCVGQVLGCCTEVYPRPRKDFSFTNGSDQIPPRLGTGYWGEYRSLEIKEETILERGKRNNS